MLITGQSNTHLTNTVVTQDTIKYRYIQQLRSKYPAFNSSCQLHWWGFDQYNNRYIYSSIQILCTCAYYVCINTHIRMHTSIHLCFCKCYTCTCTCTCNWYDTSVCESAGTCTVYICKWEYVWSL